MTLRANQAALGVLEGMIHGARELQNMFMTYGLPAALRAMECLTGIGPQVEQGAEEQLPVCSGAEGMG